jgi:replicative DNA helicase
MNELYNDADFIELVIKCMFRSKNALQKALDLHLEPEDFGTIAVYQAFVQTAIEIGEAPINSKLCLAKLKSVLPEKGVNDNSSAIEFWEFIYDNTADINEDYIIKHLPDFASIRKFQRARLEDCTTPEEVVQKAQNIISDIALRKTAQDIRVFTPFKELVLTELKDSLETGFAAVDLVARGLNYQEFGLILGHSGSGKTAVAVFSAIQNAKKGRKVLYLSIEEPAENICSRVYSNIFRICYTDLHKGSAIMQEDLKNLFNKMPELQRNPLLNLHIHDLRSAQGSITAKYLENYLDNLYATTGFHPDLVYIDQMDYLTTNSKFDSEWQKYGKVAFEIDELSNHLIGGEHKFSVWLLHQAGGKMTKNFSNAEITGFKGIIKPTDMALAIGRDSSQSTLVSIFSLKSRHAKNFRFDYIAELEFMNFEELDNGAEDRMKMEHEDKTKFKQNNFANVPQKKSMLLPSSNTGFNSTK